MITLPKAVDRFNNSHLKVGEQVFCTDETKRKF